MTYAACLSWLIFSALGYSLLRDLLTTPGVIAYVIELSFTEERLVD